MSKFTNGEWEYSEYIPEGITLNGKEYLIQADGEDVALAQREADARLIVAAPEMYDTLERVHKILYRFDKEGIIDVVDLANIVKGSALLLNRIDGEEAAHE